MALATLGKMAAGYAISKGKKHAIGLSKKAISKGAKIVKKALSKKASKYLGKEGVEKIKEIYAGGAGSSASSSFSSTAPPSKVHKEMINNGQTKEKETQVAAYKPFQFGGSKKQEAANRIGTHATKKLLTQGRALTYGGEATMKTRR